MPTQIQLTRDLQYGGEIGTIPSGTVLTVTGDMYDATCWRCQYGDHTVCVNKSSAIQLP